MVREENLTLCGIIELYICNIILLNNANPINLILKCNLKMSQIQEEIKCIVTKYRVIIALPLIKCGVQIKERLYTYMPPLFNNKN